MKKFFSLLLLLVVVTTTQAQNPFFEVVNYRGAFAPAPTTPWTDGWVSWDPQHSTPYSSTADSAARPLVNVTDSIRTNTTWTSDKVYKISGLIYVTNGATLTIQAGTLIQGDASVANSSLVITRGSKINAIGTSSNPIVFTSSKDTGLRAKGDWGGIIILGRSTVNKSGGIGNIEGVATSAQTTYGGATNPDDNDNSGNLKYVRIEFGGYIFATDQEINGLTLGAVGRNTVIDYVQCSYINDDAFEWFGGTVNCSHLVAFKCVDDNFDTDNGFSGSVQFGLGVRDPLISDQSASSTSEGFESDNDASGSANTPKTSAVFSNITDISGFFGLDSAARVTRSKIATFKFSVGARIRRNSNLKIFNSIMMDAPYGVRIDDAVVSGSGFNFPVSANLQTGTTKFKNNIVAGNLSAAYKGTRQSIVDSLFNQFGNDSLRNTTGLLVSPYDSVNTPDYRPATGSLALSNVNFNDAAFDGRKIIISNKSFIKEVSYRGAFAPAPSVMWTDTWTNWDPKHATYPSATDTIRGNITANTTWTSNKTYCVSGLVYVQNGVTLTIQPGTVILGDYSTPNSSLVITKGAKLNAIGTVDSPIVFTSGKDTASRAKGDWGGIILLGRASVNKAGGIGNIEGIAATTSTEYGGGASPNDNDNSGTLKYVRIEFGGYIFATDQEINGLTFGAVGRGTTIDYVQCSYINDDAFEWFGGTVNCAHLVAYKCLDDNFDTDNGFSGSVQFGLGVRDSLISDQSSSSTSEGFESDNDASGSNNFPKTSALFSNITDISGFLGSDSANRVRLSKVTSFKFSVGARIRRNSNLKIFNSIMMDAPWGVRIDDAVVSGSGFNFPVSANLQSGVTKFKNNLVAGNLAAAYKGTRQSIVDSLFGTGTGMFKNDSLRNTTNVLVNPYNTLAPDFRPGSNPLATTGFSFTDSAFNGLIALCDDVNAPGVISGASNISGCTNPQTYSIPAIANASYYTWSVTGGATIASGQGTRTITVNFPSTATYTGVITVVGKNDCGNTSAGSTKSITKVTLGTPGVISGPTAFATNVCTLVGKDTTITYTIAAVAGATNYAWTAPSNALIVTGQGTNTITVKFLNGYTTATAGDTLRVLVSSSCVTAAVKKLAIKAALPAAPTAITIGAIQTNVCNARKYRYSVPVSTAAGFTGYSWSFQGPLYSTMTIDSGSLTSRVLTVTFTSNSAAAAADSVKCFYTSSCGNTAAKAAKLSNTNLAAPATPTAITITSVAQNVCNARVYRYSAPNLPVASTTAGAATAWNWELIGALSEYASIDSGDVNSQKILVTFTSNAASATGDSIKLFYSSNGCGNSLTKAAKMSNTKLSAPAAPTAITITALQTNVCGARKYRYSAPALPAASTTAGAATGYVWSFVGSKIPTIDSGSLTSRTFTATFTSNAAAATGDSVKVYYTSDCGNTVAKASKLSNSALGVPAAPTTLTIQLKSDVCGARTYRYIAPATLPVATTTAGAASGYLWSFVGSLGANATIDSGNATSQVITATYSLNTAAATGDSVKLQFTSGCGNSTFKASKLSNLAKVCLTSGTQITSRVEATTTKAQVYPNPNNGNFTLNVATGVTAKANATVQIVDMLGKVVMTTTVTNNNGSIFTNINNSNLVDGVYTVRYTVGNVTNAIKMVVKK